MQSPEVVLVATPWPYYTMPSIQVSVLKAYLNDHGIPTAARHVHLEVAHWLGYSNYNSIISDFLEDGEALYGYLLFPELRDAVMCNTTFRSKNITVERERIFRIPSKEFFDEFDHLHRKIVSEICKPSVKIVGFTLNFGQTVSSLYMAKLVKALRPDIQIVLGGAEASGELGQSLLKNFDQIDFVCNGEGELPLQALAEKIISGGMPAGIPGITSRGYLPPSGPQRFSQIRNLGDLPCPDFTEYFDAILERGIDPSVCRCLPVESSRGCYYSCSFCALNLQWENFRELPIANVVTNLREL
jgi:magnesium-protoporphyrin IX monomethyl ester (oxidative) cyclase